jgi:hypothetical protein
MPMTGGFAFFEGACTRGIYDNMKTAVEAILVGKERAYNRRFLQMCSHYLVDPVACTPASGWEKGQVENQVGLVRERFFTPRIRVKSYEELNAWLLDQCITYAKVHRHPEVRDHTVWQMFEAERPSLAPLRSAATESCTAAFSANIPRYPTADRYPRHHGSSKPRGLPRCSGRSRSKSAVVVLALPRTKSHSQDARLVATFELPVHSDNAGLSIRLTLPYCYSRKASWAAYWKISACPCFRSPGRSRSGSRGRANVR